MQTERLDRRIVMVLSFAIGAAVANIYYAQPLLAEIGDDLDVSSAVVGLLVTASQIGYALGLAFIVPLGDLKEARRLVSQLFIACTIALVITAAAPTFAVLAIALIAVGVTASLAQILVPLAATLAHDAERGRVVGVVMSGLVIGILIARILSGALADLGGWRLPFIFGAVVMLVLLTAIRALLPAVEPKTGVHYGELLKSVIRLIRDESVLRQRMVYGAASMSSFSILWTALTFLLASTYGYSEGTIGLFGLVGIAGAAAAQLAGHAVDRGWLHQTTGATLSMCLLGWVLLAFGAHSLAALLAGILVLDFGLRGQQICSQNAIYARRPESRSRMTTAFMTSNFLWGAVASAAASVTYSLGGWTAVVVLGITVSAFAVLVWFAEQAGRRRAAEVAVSRNPPPA